MSLVPTEIIPLFVRKRVNESPILQKIIHNTGWLFLDKLIRIGVGFLVGVWITRYLGPEQFGMLSYAAAFVGLFTAVANLGLYAIVVRELVRFPDSNDEILGTAFVLKFVGGFVALILSLVILCLTRKVDSLTFWLVSIAAFGLIFQSFEVFDFFFQSRMQSKKTVMANIPGFFIITVGKIVLVLSSAPLIAFAWAGALEILLGGLGLFTAYRMMGEHLKFSWKRAKNLLKDCWPLIFAGLMLMIYNRIDQVMIGQMLGSRPVGLYSVAVKIAEFWYVFPTLILNSVLPSIVAAKESGEEFYYRRIQKVFDLMALISLAFVVPLFLFSNKLILLLYGQAFADAGAILAIYVLSGIFVFIGHVREYWITVENVARFSLYSTTIGAASNVILNLVLIPSYGGLGAAYATLVSLFVATYLVNFFHAKTRPIFVMQTKAIFLVTCFKRIRSAMT